MQLLDLVFLHLVDAGGNVSSSEFCECTLSDNSLPLAGIWWKSESQYSFHPWFYWNIWFNTNPFWRCSKQWGTGTSLTDNILLFTVPRHCNFYYFIIINFTIFRRAIWKCWMVILISSWILVWLSAIWSLRKNLTSFFKKRWSFLSMVELKHYILH